jgi:hypothetical protein
MTITAPDEHAVELLAPMATTLVDGFAPTTAEKADQPAIRASAADGWITWRESPLKLSGRHACSQRSA